MADVSLLSLRMSAGWLWRMELSRAGAELAHIVQFAPTGEIAGEGITLHITDLPWFAHWLRGSYSGHEWPPERMMPSGATLFVEPNPTPELWIERRTPRPWTHADSDDFQWEHDSLGDPQQERDPVPTPPRLMLFQEDLQPLVGWLEQCSEAFGVDTRSAGKRRSSGR